MAATNWTIIKREKTSNQMLTINLGAKWTYKTALGIASYRDWETDRKSVV